MKREAKLLLESSATYSLKVLPVSNVKLPLSNVHTCTKDYLWASKQPLELPQDTLVPCSVKMQHSYGYKGTVSQRNGYSERTEKTESIFIFKGYCLQIWIDVNILNQLCTVLFSAWMALCASQINGFIFIYQSYLIVTWVFILSRLQTSRSAPPPFWVEKEGSESPTKRSALFTYTSLWRKREILPPTPTEDHRWVTKTWISLSQSCWNVCSSFDLSVTLLIIV